MTRRIKTDVNKLNMPAKIRFVWFDDCLYLPFQSMRATDCCRCSQVIVEGVADRRSAGHIAVDNIQIMDGLHAEDCKGVYRVVMTHLVTLDLFLLVLCCIPSLCSNLMEAVLSLQIQKLLRLHQLRSSSSVSTLLTPALSLQCQYVHF